MIKGLLLSETYYHTCGEPVFNEKFPFLKERMAVGLVGHGSECFCFDDAISRDHDYGPSFCVWLSEDDYSKYGKQLQVEYNALPKVFEGLPVRNVSPNGEGRVGVFSINSFYYGLLGIDKAPLRNIEWMKLPEERLAVAVNGKVFCDNLGEFTSIRKQLLNFYPEDVRIKKIVARAAVMSQSGQYNYQRCMKRNEYVAAQLAIGEFINSTISMVYLLNKKYTPFYKWKHRGMRELNILSEIEKLLTLLVETNIQREAWENVKPQDFIYTLNTADQCVVIMESICGMVVAQWKKQNLTTMDDNFLQNHLPILMEKIEDQEIKNCHVLEG